MKKRMKKVLKAYLYTPLFTKYLKKSINMVFSENMTRKVRMQHPYSNIANAFPFYTSYGISYVSIQ